MSQRFRSLKMRELVLYIAEKSISDQRFGAVKLNKLLYYSDFYAYRVLGSSITGAKYQRLQEGPAPRQFLTVRDSLLDDGSAVLEERPFFTQTQQRLVPRRPVRPGVLSEAERRLVDEVIENLWWKTGREVSEMSHQEPGWKVVTEGETIPYETAWLSADPLSQAQVERGLEVAKRHELLAR